MFDGASLLLLAAVFILWDGATESVYSIGNAHAGDKAKKEEMVELSATMLFAWSVSGFLVPGIATALTARFGTIAYFPLAIAIALLFAAFVIWRIMTTQTAVASQTRRHHRRMALPHRRNWSLERQQS